MHEHVLEYVYIYYVILVRYMKLSPLRYQICIFDAHIPDISSMTAIRYEKNPYDTILTLDN